MREEWKEEMQNIWESGIFEGVEYLREWKVKRNCAWKRSKVGKESDIIEVRKIKKVESWKCEVKKTSCKSERRIKEKEERMDKVWEKYLS